MTPDGKLAAEPILIEASASAKGPALMQSAIAALEACQPYAMLPADRYGEWKVLDLSFTPQDFWARQKRSVLIELEKMRPWSTSSPSRARRSRRTAGAR